MRMTNDEWGMGDTRANAVGWGGGVCMGVVPTPCRVVSPLAWGDRPGAGIVYARHVVGWR